MGLRNWLNDRNPYNPAPQLSRGFGLGEYLEAIQYGYGGNTYTLPVSYTMKGDKEPPVTGEFQSLVAGAYKRNGVVFSASLARSLVFSDVEFKFQSLTDKKLYGTPALGPLEENTGPLLAKMEQDVTLDGNWFGTTRYGGITRLQPNWVDVMLASSLNPEHPGFASDAQVVGYVYRHGGETKVTEWFAPSEVAHWAPIPDPDSHFRGMSWLTPVVREIMADNSGTDLRLKFYENGATPNMVVEAPDWVKDHAQYKEWKGELEGSSAGVRHAFKTLFLASGSSATTVGLGLRDIDFKSIQGAGETRVLIASRVPAVIAGISEGLAGSSLNQGNYGMARRQFGDMFLRPQWRDACGALAKLVPAPAGSRLWFDPSVVSFLQEDEKDAADIMQVKAGAVRQFIEAGFDADSAVSAVAANDERLLKHTGMVSVQLQDPTKAPSPTNPLPPAGEDDNV